MEIARSKNCCLFHSQAVTMILWQTEIVLLGPAGENVRKMPHTCLCIVRKVAAFVVSHPRKLITLSGYLFQNQGTAKLRFITLGARDFSSAVSGFCQVFIVTRAFFSRLRPTAEDVSAFGQHRNFPAHARKTSGTRGTALWTPA